MIAQKVINTTPKNLSNDITRTLQNLKSLSPLDKTCLPTLDGNIFMGISEISQSKSEDIYCRLYTRDGQVYFITKPLKWVEFKLFKFGFYRIHKSYFINVLNIQKYRKGEGGYLEMENGCSIPISRSKKGELQRLLEEF